MAKCNLHIAHLSVADSPVTPGFDRTRLLSQRFIQFQPFCIVIPCAVGVAKRNLHVAHSFVADGQIAPGFDRTRLLSQRFEQFQALCVVFPCALGVA